MKPTRRMGPTGSASWNAILDSSEEILKEEGYGALTSRRIAERMGIKQRLIYYYFQTMNELIVHTFRRLAERDLLRLKKTLSSPRPLHELWHFCIHTADGRLISEFMALANRIDGLRSEVVVFIEESRRIQIAALQEAMTPDISSRVLSPAAIALFASSVGLLLIREAELGVTTGHIEVAAAIGQFLALAEPIPRSKPPNKRKPAKSKGCLIAG
jgi:AcrR family transcriptional regulator